MLIFSLSIIAYAATNYSWNQGQQVVYYKPGNDYPVIASAGDTVIFEGVAYGSSTGNFGVYIESKGINDPNSSYTVESSMSWRYVTPTTGTSYNTSTGQTVSGQYFRLYWNIPNDIWHWTPKTYRVVLNKLGSNTQIVYLNSTWFYKQ